MVLSLSRHYRVGVQIPDLQGAKGPARKRVIRPDSDHLVSSFERILPACREQNVGTAVAGITLRFPLRCCPRIIAIRRRTDACAFGKSPKETSASIGNKAGAFSVVSASHLSDQRLTQIPQFVIHLGGVANRAADFFTQDCPIPSA
jgi:hypothetical protein